MLFLETDNETGKAKYNNRWCCTYIGAASSISGGGELGCTRALVTNKVYRSCPENSPGLVITECCST